MPRCETPKPQLACGVNTVKPLTGKTILLGRRPAHVLLNEPRACRGLRGVRPRIVPTARSAVSPAPPGPGTRPGHRSLLQGTARSARPDRRVRDPTPSPGAAGQAARDSGQPEDRQPPHHVAGYRLAAPGLDAIVCGPTTAMPTRMAPNPTKDDSRPLLLPPELATAPCYRAQASPAEAALVLSPVRPNC